MPGGLLTEADWWGWNTRLLRCLRDICNLRTDIHVDASSTFRASSGSPLFAPEEAESYLVLQHQQREIDTMVTQQISQRPRKLTAAMV